MKFEQYEGTGRNKWNDYFIRKDIIVKVVHYCGGSYGVKIKSLPPNCKKASKDVPYFKRVLKSFEKAKDKSNFSIIYGV